MHARPTVAVDLSSADLAVLARAIDTGTFPGPMVEAAAATKQELAHARFRLAQEPATDAYAVPDPGGAPRVVVFTGVNRGVNVQEPV